MFNIYKTLLQQTNNYGHYIKNKNPRHLICFKQWTAEMVLEIIYSAINAKCRFGDTHGKRTDILHGSKVMILQELNEPVLNMAVSKAATFLGAHDTNVTDRLVWDNDYSGRVFSQMADVIFVSTSTHMCVQRFADQSTVPVLCMRSRTHASIQSLATIMAVIEEFGTMQNLTLSYIGPPHPVLNSYLLLCPMLGAHIRYKCWCNEKQAVSPLLKKASEEITLLSKTICEECISTSNVLTDACAIISGPTSTCKEKAKDNSITIQDIQKNTKCPWIYFHTCPRGDEVDNQLFWHSYSRTFNAFNNMQYITSALMANAIKGYNF